MDTTHLSSFIDSDSDSDSDEKFLATTDNLNTILTKIIGDYMNKLYFNSEREEKAYRSLWGLNAEDTEPNRQIIRDYTMRDLFLWSILMNHIDMAKVLLFYNKYRICAALIATKILKQYHSKAAYGELKANYMKNANYFQQYAIDCITQCEKNNLNQACQIVLQRIDLYGNVSCLQVL